ncbi:uncharacterized protein [Ptychodera flava]|uniref:uncharacterized protein n=1 Tax=Ptychodera flava TaxID=63121 RepID=UPI003969C2BD
MVTNTRTQLAQSDYDVFENKSKTHEIVSQCLKPKMTLIMSSLNSVVKTGDTNAVREMLLQSDVSVDTINYQDPERRETALFCACARGFFAIVQLLLSCKARLDLYTIWGGTPLHAAAENGHEDVVRILLLYRAAVNAQTHYGDTALHLAAFRGHFNVVKILVEAGADTTLRNVKWNRPFEEARINGHTVILQYLERLMRTSTAQLGAVPCTPVSVEYYTTNCTPEYLTCEQQHFGNGDLEPDVNDLGKIQVDSNQCVGFASNIPIADGMQTQKTPFEKTIQVSKIGSAQSHRLKSDYPTKDGSVAREPVECDDSVADCIIGHRQPVESLDPTAMWQAEMGAFPKNSDGLTGNDGWIENQLKRCREELTGIQITLQQTRMEIASFQAMDQHTNQQKYLCDKENRLLIREHDLLSEIAKLESGLYNRH